MDASLAATAYEDHGREILAFLRTRTRGEEAEDLCQETFLRLHAEAMAGRPPDNVRAWLYRVAANLATSHGRRQQVATKHEPALRPTGSATSTETVVIRREEDAEVRDALATLRPADRDVLLMAAAGLTGAEIGARLERSPMAARTLLCRARAQLRALVTVAEAGATG
jgi:RNA polymerase sigma-70 factor (ECF subfamily)